MRSMTGFAQGRFVLDGFSINITIKSLNHRYLDITIKGSGVSNEIEKIVKDIFKGKILRGKIEVLIDIFDSKKKDWDIKFNDNLLNGILDKVLYFKKKYKSELTLSLDSLLKIPMIFHLDQLNGGFNVKENNSIRNSVKKVLKEFIKSRDEEGKSISDSILECIGKIDDNLVPVQKGSHEFEKEIYLKYSDKIKKIVSENDIDEKRIIQEAAILAEKNCINEEISRLKTHTKRLKNLVNNKKLGLKGKESDFLTQEMLRETSTISAKTGSMKIHEHILLIRREIEKIKQQVQNVE